MTRAHATRRVSTIERFVAMAEVRRELLWLRAKEKDDEVSALDLQHADPMLVERLIAAGADIAGHVNEDPRARRERFGRLWDECYRRHALELWRDTPSEPTL